MELSTAEQFNKAAELQQHLRSVYADSLVANRRMTNQSEIRSICKELYCFNLGLGAMKMGVRANAVYGLDKNNHYPVFEKESFTTQAFIICELARALRRDSLKKRKTSDLPQAYKFNQGRYSQLKTTLSSIIAGRPNATDKSWAMEEFLDIQSGRHDHAL